MSKVQDEGKRRIRCARLDSMLVCTSSVYHLASAPLRDEAKSGAPRWSKKLLHNLGGATYQTAFCFKHASSPPSELGETTDLTKELGFAIINGPILIMRRQPRCYLQCEKLGVTSRYVPFLARLRRVAMNVATSAHAADEGYGLRLCLQLLACALARSNVPRRTALWGPIRGCNNGLQRTSRMTAATPCQLPIQRPCPIDGSSRAPFRPGR